MIAVNNNVPHKKIVTIFRLVWSVNYIFLVEECVITNIIAYDDFIKPIRFVSFFQPI